MFRSTALTNSLLKPKAFHSRTPQTLSYRHWVIRENRSSQSTFTSALWTKSTNHTQLRLVKDQVGSVTYPELKKSNLIMRKQSFGTNSSKESAPAGSSTSSTSAATEQRPLWFKILQRFEGIPYPPLSAKWWMDKLIVFFVFAVTGSSTLFFVRPLLANVLHITGTMIDGPWSYRLAAIFLITPAYTALLLTFGTLAGRREFFLKLARKMWGRFLPRGSKGANKQQQQQQHEQNKTDVQK